jgi:iron-sulfur cluster repair protein YtfE (RIC family)
MAILSRYLTGDHESCDRQFAESENRVAAGDWPAADSEFKLFRSATLSHFRREEAILFPPFEQRTGMIAGPTSIMRSEHEQMRGILEAMAGAVSDRDMESYLGHSETLLMLLRQHNIKEEQILYPMIDRTLADEAAELLSRMQDETD